MPLIEGFSIIKLLGAGAMGEVYLAEQLKPLRRTVALKLMRPTGDQDIQARFEYERTVLARMSHPYVAQVFDAGTTHDSRPYFVMEYIDGVPITEYCEREAINLRDRLELFRKVCEAVQHAHQNGYIHRDIKPSNVLVTLADEMPVPKVIDFGIARAVGRRALGQSGHTLMGVVLGTPAYMSPEQARSSRVDTRTDVYSLGILLYEILVGTPPFDPKSCEGATLEEFRRVVQEADPPRPSARVEAVAKTLESQRTNVFMPIEPLAKALRKELDWIVMHALEKDPDRRYQSPYELSSDIGRYLQGEPIVARPPSTSYQLRKLVSRHKLPFTLAVSVVGLLAVVAVGMTIETGRIARERARADREAATAQQTASFLMGLFAVSDPTSGEGKTISARQILERGAKNIREALKDQATTQASMMDTIGMVYRSLGLYDEALPYLREALETRRHLGPGGAVDVGASELHLGMDLRDLGNLDESETSLREAIDGRKSLLGPDTAEVAEAYYELGRLLYDKGKYPEADESLHKALAIQEAILGPETQAVSSTINSLAELYDTQGRTQDAEALYKRAMAIDEKTLAPDNPSRAEAYNNLAELYRVQKRFDEAEPLYKRCLEVFEKALDPYHPNLATIYNNLGLLYRAQKRYPEAEDSYARSRAILLRVFGSEHPYVAASTNSLGVLKTAQGKYPEAEPLLKLGLSIRQKVLPPDHPDIAESLFNLAYLYDKESRFAEAEPLYKRSLDMRVEGLGKDHPLVGKTMDQLAGVLRKLGRKAEAEEFETQAKVIRELHERAAAAK